MRKSATRFLLPVSIWMLLAIVAIGGFGGCSYLPFMKSENVQQKKVRTLWQSGEQYVAIEKQDQVQGVPEKPNEHVSEISVDRLRTVLASMQMRSQDSDKAIALFNEDELRILSEFIAEGLAVAGPDEDVTFAIIGHYVDALGFLKRRMVTTGRIFCQDGQLNIIFGDVHRLLTETMGRPEDRRLNPFSPGSRSGSTGKDMKGFLIPKKDGEIFAKMRDDWVIFPLKGPEVQPAVPQETGVSEAGKGEPAMGQ